MEEENVEKHPETQYTKDRPGTTNHPWKDNEMSRRRMCCQDSPWDII